MNFRVLFIFLLAVFLVGCGQSKGKVRGKTPRGDVKTVVAIRAGDTPPSVTVSGTIEEKCPVAGCWFWLKDSTGVIRVETKAAGFVVTDIPLHKQVLVAGKLVDYDGETVLEATGLRF